MRLSARAARQVRALRRHYEELERPEAPRNLMAALDGAWQRIATKPQAGLPAPRPYPQLAKPGRAWIKSGRYWVGYAMTQPPLIFAIFHESAHIPGRL